MDRDAVVSELLEHLGVVQGLPLATSQQRRLALRASFNVRPPGPLNPEVLALHDTLLAAEAADRVVVNVADLPVSILDPRLALWRGDITTLQVGAIVNAANSALLGCFSPLHHCVDNAIHSAAGMMLREECAAIMADRGRPEPSGTATVTSGYHLPADYVIHTVGPIVEGQVREEHQQALASCYRSCLQAAAAKDIASIAFCCISTGVFGYPPTQAAPLAIRTVREALPEYPTIEKVVFCVFSETDEKLYRSILEPSR